MGKGKRGTGERVGRRGCRIFEGVVESGEVELLRGMY